MMNEEVQGLSTLGQPMVSPLAPVVTQDAVQKLVDAYHQGFITTNDILEHTGALAQAKGQSALDLLKITPDIVEAQKAQANLNTAKARAEIGLIPGTTDLTRAKTAADFGLLPTETEARRTALNSTTAKIDYGDLLDMLPKYHIPPTFTTDKDGKPVRNVQADVALGAKLAMAEADIKRAQIEMTPRIPGGETEFDPVLGRNVIVFRNADTVKLVPDSPFMLDRQERITKARDFLTDHNNTSWHPDNLIVPASHDDSAAKALAGKPTVTPTSAAAAPSPVADFVSASGLPAASAEALIRAHLPVVTPAAPQQTTVTNHPDGSVSTMVTPAAKPVINPGEAQTSGMQNDQQSSIPGAIVPQLPPEALAIPEKTRAMVPVNLWLDKKATIDQFQATKADYARDPKQVTNQLDAALARQALILSSSSSSGRGPNAQEGSIKRIEDAVPLIERALNLKGLVFKNEQFPKETRDRIIAAMEHSVKSLEDNARGGLSVGHNMLAMYGVRNPKKFFSPQENALFDRGTTSSGAGVGPGVVRETEYGGTKYKVGF